MIGMASFWGKGAACEGGSERKKNLALIGQCGSERRSGLVRTQKKVTLKKSERSEKKMREGTHFQRGPGWDAEKKYAEGNSPT